MIHITTTNLYLTVRNSVDLGPILERLTTMDQRIQDGLDDLSSKVEANTSVEQSAVALLNGLSAQVAAAIEAAKNAGASDAQVQAFSDLRASLDTSTQDLAAAVAANTPASP